MTLPVVFAAGHEPERSVDAARREGTIRQRSEHATFNQTGDFRHQLPRPRVRRVGEDRIHRHDVEGGCNAATGAGDGSFDKCRACQFR